MIVKAQYEQLYANKFENVDEMNKFLEKIYLYKLTQDKIENRIL